MNDYVFAIHGMKDGNYLKSHLVQVSDNGKLINHLLEEIELAVSFKEKENAEEESKANVNGENELFSTLLKSSPLLQMNINSHNEIVEAIQQKVEFLKETKEKFMNDAYNAVSALYGKETANKFIEFLDGELKKPQL